MKKTLLNLMLAVVAIITSGTSAYAAPLYIFGSFNGWDPANSTEMTYANGVYTLEDILLDSGSNFAFATIQSRDWNTVNANRYGFAVDNAFAILGGTPNPIVKGAGAMQVGVAGVYDITVDLNAMTMTLTGEIAYPEHVYVLGNLSVGEWNTNSGVELFQGTTAGIYTGTISVNDTGDGNGYFTLVTALGADWSAVNESVRYGATEKDEPIYEGETKALKSTGGGSENSWKIAAGEWDVTANLNTLTITVNKSNGIAGITMSAAETPAMYYNLQGVQITNPAGGLYIVKRGNNATKEYISK